MSRSFSPPIWACHRRQGRQSAGGSQVTPYDSRRRASAKPTEPPADPSRLRGAERQLACPISVLARTGSRANQPLSRAAQTICA